MHRHRETRFVMVATRGWVGGGWRAPGVVLGLALVCLPLARALADEGAEGSDEADETEASDDADESEAGHDHGEGREGGEGRKEAGAEGDAPEGDDAEGEPGRDGSSAEPPAEGEEPPVIRTVAPNRHLAVKAKSLRLTEPSAERLLRIAKRYHDATGQPIVITGGDRGAARQAELMYKKLHNGEDLLKLYARDDLVRPIVATYERGKRDGLTKKRITRAMTDVIAEQMANRQFVSSHLAFTAADVRSRDMTPAQEAAFFAAVKAEPGVRLVDERSSASPCFHLGL
jgi:hypothetical protein